MKGQMNKELAATAVNHLRNYNPPAWAGFVAPLPGRAFICSIIEQLSGLALSLTPRWVRIDFLPKWNPSRRCFVFYFHFHFFEVFGQLTQQFRAT